MSLSSLIEETQPVERGGFECNVLVLGMLAKVYGQHSPSTPMRGWGGAERNATIHWDGKTWAAAANRKGGKAGLRLTIRNEHTNELVDDVWIAFADLDKLTVMLDVESY